MKRINKYLSKGLFLIILISNCMPVTMKSLTKAEQDQIKIRSYRIEYKKVFNAVLDGVVYEGFSLQSTDIQSGIIITDYKTGSKIFINKRQKLNIRIEKIEDKLIKVRIDLVEQFLYGGIWNPFDDYNAEYYKNDVNKIFAAIENNL